MLGCAVDAGWCFVLAGCVAGCVAVVAGCGCWVVDGCGDRVVMEGLVWALCWVVVFGGILIGDVW